MTAQALSKICGRWEPWVLRPAFRRGTQEYKTSIRLLLVTGPPGWIVSIARILIPIVIVVPGMIAGVPPLMVSIPAFLSFNAKVMPGRIRLRAVRSVAMDFTVQPRPRVLDAMLAMSARIRVSQLRRR